jgi:hypothetical protein
MKASTTTTTARPGDGRVKIREAIFTILALCAVLFIVQERKSLSELTLGSSVSSVSSSGIGFADDEDDFVKAATMVYGKIIREEGTILDRSDRHDFQLKEWTKQTNGGLTDDDRKLLAKMYRKADSVFEYGLGESTYIANEVGVARYAGIDSDVAWVDKTRKSVSDHFRFYYGDIGNTGTWGFPKNADLAKSIWQYQVAPLQAELQPFDVYMVDGRYRIPCVLLSFLHASSRGADPSDTIVLLHDCYKKGLSDESHKNLNRHYQVLDAILEVVDHSRQLLCVYKRKKNTSDDMILDMYKQYQDDLS